MCDPQQEGRIAWERGLLIFDNPYTEWSDPDSPWSQWRLGYEAALELYMGQAGE